MILIRMIIASVLLLSILVYMVFLLVSTDPCTRINRATIPVVYATDIAKAAAKPWSSPQTMQAMDVWGAKTRLRFALLFRIQFYSDSVPPVLCDWDQYKDQILGGDSTLKDKDTENQKNVEQQIKQSQAGGK